MTEINRSTLIINRIMEYYKFKSQAEFADFLGVKTATISNWRARDTLDFPLLFTKCKEVDANFLLSGSGSMLKNQPKTGQYIAGDNNKMAGNSIVENTEITKTINELKKQIENKDAIINSLIKHQELLLAQIDKLTK